MNTIIEVAIAALLVLAVAIPFVRFMDKGKKEMEADESGEE